MAKIYESQLIKGVLHVEMQAFQDERGMFVETFRQEWFKDLPEMVQSNRSESKKGVLRGLHYHCYQADFWHVPYGRVLVVLHDLRTGSPTLGVSEYFEMGEGDAPLRGVYIPRGVAHGFYAITDCTMTYMVDNYYSRQDELGVLWSDPALGVVWPSSTPSLSERDRLNPLIADIPEHLRPSYRLPIV